MNERAEQNADVLGKLTVLGTIVLPMNIITGLWYVESLDYPKRIAKI
jgi:Mg2+ and Co2+ transporter CorA